MQIRKILLPVLLLALVFTVHAGAAEPAAPQSAATANACASSLLPAMSLAAQPTAPFLLEPAASPAATVLPRRCGCGDAACVGKLTGDSCGRLICAANSLCASIVPATSHCVCILPP
jgi:hypothetical protein